MEVGVIIWERMRTVAVAALLACAAAGVNAATIYDSGGFEPTRFVPGPLQGQDPLQGPWQVAQLTGSTSTAVVETLVKNGGLQAVQLNRGAVLGDVRYAVLKPTAAPAAPITVQWDMNVQQSTVPAGSFGPFFGVEMYNSLDAPSGPQLIGSLGVDAVTGELLFQDTGTGFIDVLPATVAFNTWHTFKIVADFQVHQYQVYLDNVLQHTEGFVDPGIVNFTDASISALGTGGDAGSQAATGTAYYDNYTLTIVPEPVALAWVGLVVVDSEAG